MSRVLIPLNEPPMRDDGRMAGLQLRAYELARALARRGHDISVAHPGKFDARKYSPDGTVRLIPLHQARSDEFDVCLSHPTVHAALPSRLQGLPLILDGYEFPFASFFAQAEHQLGRVGRRARIEYRRGVRAYVDRLLRASAVVAANESQRLGYLSILCALGAIQPGSTENVPVVVAQSAVPPERPPAVHDARAFVDNHAGPVVLVAGGSYPWFDARALVAALGEIATSVDEVAFLFVGIDGRDGTSDGNRHDGAVHISREVASSPTLAGRSFFRPWLPYADRHRAYAASDIAIVAQSPGIEALFSMRTRVLDLIWGGLPAVVVDGDPLSTALSQHGAAIVVPAAQPSAIAEAAVRLLSEPTMTAVIRDRLAELGNGMLGWEAQTEQLHALLNGSLPMPARSHRRPILGLGAAILDAIDLRAAGVKRRLGAGS